MKRLLLAATTAATILATASPVLAQSYDWSVVRKVTTIEVTYMPDNLLFKLDGDAGLCTTGTFMRWNIRGLNDTAKAQNAQAVLAALITAEVSGHSVTLYGSNSGCAVDYLYIN